MLSAGPKRLEFFPQKYWRSKTVYKNNTERKKNSRAKKTMRKESANLCIIFESLECFIFKGVGVIAKNQCSRRDKDESHTDCKSTIAST